MAESADIRFPLWQLVARTYHIMLRARQRELNRYGITSGYSSVLSTVMRLGEEATLSNISHQLVREVHSMSAQLKRMEKEGLIKKAKDQNKKNLMRIIVTDKGYELYTKGMEKTTINSIMSKLTVEEQKTLWLIMVKIRQQSMIELEKEDTNLYPPSDPAELPPPPEQEGTKESILLNKPF